MPKETWPRFGQQNIAYIQDKEGRMYLAKIKSCKIAIVIEKRKMFVLIWDT